LGRREKIKHIFSLLHFLKIIDFLYRNVDMTLNIVIRLYYTI
jgi:hypothetical protein